MTKSMRILLLLLIPLLLSGCRKNEFTITFELEGDVATNLKLTYYASDKRGGMTVEAAVPIAKGKGLYTGPTVRPALVWLYRSGSDYPLAVYAERGDKIEVTGSGPDIFSWTVGGNDINKEWSAWRNSNAKALASGDAAKINATVGKYVAANPSNPLSTLLLLTSWNRREDEDGYRRLWRMLSGEAANPKWTEMAGRADQPDRLAPKISVLRNMALRSMQNGVDTIRPDSVKGSLLIFWANGLDNRKAMIDSIKALAKEFPDSSTRTIADICLENDSVSWRSASRNDSLKNVARLWVPAGLADSRMINLGVTAIPYYIVVSPDGRQRYRGEEADSAFKSFRSLLKEKEQQKEN